MVRKAKPPIAAGAQDTCVNGTVESLAQGEGSDPKLPPGTNHCLCSACGRYFGGADGFTRHRVNFKCVDPATLGLTLNRRGYWVRPIPKMVAIHGGKAIADDFSSVPYRKAGKVQ